MATMHTYKELNLFKKPKHANMAACQLLANCDTSKIHTHPTLTSPALLLLPGHLWS